MTQLRRPQIEKNIGQHRQGVAAVEFAVCLPILIVLMIGAIETTNIVFLRQSMTYAAFETAQVVTATGGTETAGLARGNEVLANYDVQGATITVSPSVDSNTTPLTLITVTVTVPADANSIGPSWFFRNRMTSKSVTMSRM